VIISTTVKLNIQADETSMESNFSPWWKIAFLLFVIHILQCLSNLNLYITV